MKNITVNILKPTRRTATIRSETMARAENMLFRLLTELSYEKEKILPACAWIATAEAGSEYKNDLLTIKVEEDS